MQENEFLREIADIMELELTEVSLDQHFRVDIATWDSMKAFGCMSLIEDACNGGITPDQFRSFQTFQDIFNYISVNER